VFRDVVAAALAVLLSAPLAWGQAGDRLGIDHRYANTDAQSLIGLPMGSHKTTVSKEGSLVWSQWSLKRKPLDSPIGFSSQMDGALAIEPSAVSDIGVKANPVALAMTSQTLYRGRYPFVVSRLSGGGLELEELAFSVDPEQDPAQLPTASSGSHALDVVRFTVHNGSTGPLTFRLELSGRSRNLPGHVRGQSLVTGGGELVATVSEVGSTAPEPVAEDNGLSLREDLPLAPGASKVVWVRLPYEFPVSRQA
jgi:hypothetical protein